MAFLDALAKGLVVIAQNGPTMNEYIEDGVNSYLYDIKNPKKIDLSNIEIIRENARRKIENGFNLWQQQQEDILVYIEKTITQRNKKKKIMLSYFFHMCNFTIRCLRKVKQIFYTHNPIVKGLRKIKRKWDRQS